MKKRIFGLGFLFFGAVSLFGQALPTATRTFDLQAGGGFVLAKSDYEPQRFKGYAIYATVDVTSHFGAEIDFRQANSPVDKQYERTYEIGGRYHRHYGRFEPYVKALYGRGVFNYVFDTYNLSGAVVTSTQRANLAYNEFVGGGGVDFHLLHNVNLRGDYEYQDWHSFPTHGLTPQLVTVGVAYHLPGGLGRGRHWK